LFDYSTIFYLLKSILQNGVICFILCFNIPDMKTHLECIPCTLNSYLRLVDTAIIPPEKREELMRDILVFLSDVDYRISPPAMGRELHRMIRASLQNPDPYLEIKEKYNRMMLELYPSFREMVAKSSAPCETAMRLAMGGNVIDFGAKYQFDVMETIHSAMDHELAIDDTASLKTALANARRLLYIGDNCGEIVLDKLFLESIDVAEKTFAVRGGPVVNDITREDAERVGMERVARVVTTGDDSPGAVWERTSREFRRLFQEADVVISKGQGNLEGLMEVRHDQIYFLLVIKCDLIGERIGSANGSFIVRKGSS
jgi:uncharacterized protein with ATP-grasp and redox domains